MKKLFSAVLFFFPVLLNAQTLLSEDFSSGIPAGWTNVDNGGNNVLWQTTLTGAFNLTAAVDVQLSPAGTSAANGYLILDSDAAGSVQVDAVLTTPVINCSGHSAVRLSFNEYFAQYGASAGIVQVSNDNVSWVDYHHAETGLSQDSGTANPWLQIIDISATAANQSTVYVRFNYQGNYDYWWFVDDVIISAPFATDLSSYSIEKLNSEYTKIPVSQATALTLSAVVQNTGLNMASGGNATFEVVDAGTTLPVFSEVIAIPSLAPGSIQQVTPSLAFTPPAAGAYYSRLTVAIAGDGNPSNDMIQSGQFLISDTVYQRDNDILTDAQGIGAGPGENGIAGQNFRINAPGALTSVTFFLKDTFSFSVSGTPLFFTVHPQVNDTTGPDETTVLAITDTLMLFPGSIPAGGAYYTLMLQGGALQVVPGLYFIGFNEVDVMIPMGFSSTIFTPGAVWVHFNSIPSPPAVNGWARAEDFGFQFAYMIRANFGSDPDAVNEISGTSGFMIYPNPSSGVFNIRFENAINGMFEVEVIDALGKRVFISSIYGMIESAIDLSKLQQGVYSLHVRGAKSSSVQMICISKN